MEHLQASTSDNLANLQIIYILVGNKFKLKYIKTRIMQGKTKEASNHGDKDGLTGNL